MPDGMDDVPGDDIFPVHLFIYCCICKGHQRTDMKIKVDGNMTALANTKRGTIIGNGKIGMIFLTAVLMILPNAQCRIIITGHCREIQEQRSSYGKNDFHLRAKIENSHLPKEANSFHYCYAAQGAAMASALSCLISPGSLKYTRFISLLIFSFKLTLCFLKAFYSFAI